MDNQNKIHIKDYKRTDDYIDQSPGRKSASVNEPVELPVDWLITLPGLRNEHLQLRYDMSKIQKLSELVQEKSFCNSHPIELEIHHDGSAYVFDGNHRVRAAKLANLSSYPCKITYYGGGEDNFDINNILKSYPIKKEAFDMNDPANKITLANILIEKAKLAVKAGFPYDETMEELAKIAAGTDGVGGDPAVFGTPIDQEYANQEGHGTNPGGEHDPNIGDMTRVGPRDDDEKDNSVTAVLLDSIRNSNRLYAQASHVEVIEIPLKELSADKDLDYSIRENEEFAFSAIKKYLSVNVYKGKLNFTIVRVQHEDTKFFVNILVFDRQISHASGLKSADSISKVSSLQKTAWRKRLTVAVGENDQTGLVACPIEGGFLQRGCGACPLAGNPHTYVADGYVVCHFDDMQSWLGGGNNVKEHQPKDNSSSA